MYGAWTTEQLDAIELEVLGMTYASAIMFMWAENGIPCKAAREWCIALSHKHPRSLLAAHVRVDVYQEKTTLG